MKHEVQVYQEYKRTQEILKLKQIIEEKDARIRELQHEIKLLIKLIKDDKINGNTK